jgi:hypothetical protein
MKQFLILLAMLVFVSCSNKPDNIIHDQKSEKGGWVFDSSVSKPVQQDVEYVQIAPTWGQAFHYVSKRSDRAVKLGASFIFLAVFVVLFVGKAKETSWFPQALQNMMLFNGLLFISLVAAVTFFISDPAGIKINNDKWIEKLEYEKVMKEAGSTQPIWDSLENKCLIVDGPYGCYTK